MCIKNDKEAELQLHRLHRLPDKTLLQTLTPSHMGDLLHRHRMVRMMKQDSEGVLQLVEVQSPEVVRDDQFTAKWSALSFPHFLKGDLHKEAVVGDADNPVLIWLEHVDQDVIPSQSVTAHGTLIDVIPEGTFKETFSEEGAREDESAHGNDDLISLRSDIPSEVNSTKTIPTQDLLAEFDPGESDLMGGSAPARIPDYDTIQVMARPVGQQSVQDVQHLDFPDEADMEPGSGRETTSANSSEEIETKTVPQSTPDKLTDVGGYEPSQAPHGAASLPNPVSGSGSGSVDGAKSTRSSNTSGRTRGIRYADPRSQATWDALPTPRQSQFVNTVCHDPQPRWSGDVNNNPFPPLGSTAQHPRVQPAPACVPPATQLHFPGQSQSVVRRSYRYPPGLGFGQPSATVRPPPGLAPPSNWRSPSAQPAASDAYSHVARNEIVQDQLPGSSPYSWVAQNVQVTDVVETVQDGDEVSTRRYHKTTLHRKPKGKAKGGGSKPAAKAQLKLPDDFQSLIKAGKKELKPSRVAKLQESTPKKPAEPPACVEGLLKILDVARAFKGHVDMEVSIGRILLDGFKKEEAKKFADSKAMSARSLTRGIERYIASDEATVHFVERLTSSIDEASRIPAQKMFDQDEIDTEVWYELHCRDRYNNAVVVKIRGSEEAETVLVPRALGEAFFHFPKRRWDARFAINGRETYAHRTAVSKFMKQFSAKVEGAGDMQTIDLRYRIVRELKIQEVYAKKRLTYKYLESDRISLHVTEVQDLNRFQAKFDTSLHQARSGNKSEMIRDGRFWYEAKLSISADPWFEQNLHLKTGDEANWEPKDVLDDAMLVVVDKVIEHFVSRLDVVGINNKGLRGDEKDLGEIDSRIKENKRLKKGDREHW